MDINKVTLIGRLTRAPERKEGTNGQQMAALTIATNYVWKDVKTKERRDKTEFHPIVVFGKLADIALQYLQKGSRVYLEGRMVHRTWEAQDGQKRKATSIVADEIIMLGSSKTVSTEDAGDDQLVVEQV